MLIVTAVLFFLAGAASQAWPADNADDLAQGFVSPPDQAKPRVYWCWLNGLVNKEGITRDLEEFKAKGVGGVLLFDTGGTGAPFSPPIPPGPTFLSAEWRELYKHALREADRLGIEVSVNLCSGWTAGGPWVTPEHAAKKLTWSVVHVLGPGKFANTLPLPAAVAGQFWPVAVQAFPEPSGPNVPKVTASSSQSAYPVVYSYAGEYRIYRVGNVWQPGAAPTKEKPEWIQLEYPAGVEVSSVRIMPLVGQVGNLPHEGRSPCEVEVFSSDNGTAFDSQMPMKLTKNERVVGFFPAPAKFWKIVIKSAEEGAGNLACELWLDGNYSKLDEREKLLAVKGAALSAVDAVNPKMAKSTTWSVEELTEAPNGAQVDPAKSVDLTQKLGPDRRLEWDVPAGTWTILLAGYTLTGDPVAAPSAGAGGLQLDFLNAEAVNLHFAQVAKVLLDDAGPLAGKTLKCFHQESLSLGIMNWTRGFERVFQSSRGYGLLPFLPALTGRIVTSAGATDRFLYDFRKTIAESMADNYYGHLRELSRKSGVLVQCEAGGPGAPQTQCLDALMNLGRCDVPMGEFWHTFEFKEKLQNTTGKQTASAAHVYGKPCAAAKAFVCGGDNFVRHWGLGPADLKLTADIAFCEGLNRFFLHASTCTRPQDGQPGYEYSTGTHFNPNVTWWKQSGAWLAYLGRCQYLLQQGLFVADVLYYNGDWAPNLVEAKHTDPALGLGYDYDVCNSEVLLNRLSVKEGRLVLPDGMSYRLLALPDRKLMPAEAARKIAELVRAGATVAGPRPEQDPRLREGQQLDQQVKQLAAEIWGAVDGKAATHWAVGKGRVFCGEPLRKILQDDGVQPDFEFTAPYDDSAFDFIHRSAGAADVYFLLNRRNRVERLECTFRVNCKQPEIWDPVTGRMREAGAFKQAGGRTVVPLEFEAYGSLFVVFRKHIADGAAGQLAANFPRATKLQEIMGPWTVKFNAAWGAPAEAAFDRLVDWTKHPEKGIRQYSGTATYANQFDFSANRPAQRLYLDLGKVKGLAEVRLNGKNLGVVWCAPWRVEITEAVKAGENRLEIDIVNLWPNRLIGDAALPPEKRLTRTNIPFEKGPTLLSSGLLGPVHVFGE